MTTILNDYLEEKDNINERVMELSEIIRDVETEENSGQHLQRQHRYEMERLELVGKNIVVGSQSSSVLWTVVFDIAKEVLHRQKMFYMKK
jgi:hypothetical protein